MTTLHIDIPNTHHISINKEELQALLWEFIQEYIETQEDMELKKLLQNDSEFLSLNNSLEEKLWNL